MMGNVSGTISAAAYGGRAWTFYRSMDASAKAYGIQGEINGDMNGTISAVARGGSATATSYGSTTADASAFAYGVQGGIRGDVAGTISVTAVGGRALGQGGSFASAIASAAGIEGGSVLISNFTGNVAATARGGVATTGGVARAGTATAHGISARDTLYLNAAEGSIHATAHGLSADSRAYAILGGSSADTVLLGAVDVVGDIDLRTGRNTLDIVGDVRIKGNVSATGGFNDFQIKSGLLAPVGTVRISNLVNNRMAVLSTGGLGLDLYENVGDPKNPKLVVEGAVDVQSGASIAAYAAPGQMTTNIIGNSYEVVTATNGITGTFVENEQMLLALDIIVNPTNVIITPTGLQPQEGESTPSGNSVEQASVAVVHAAMNDLSRHNGGVRALLRAPVNGGPTGPQGPDTAQRRRMEDGEWMLYVRQFNYFGEQDSDDSIAGYDWNAYGFMVGAERLMEQGLVFGGAAGGAWPDLDAELGARNGNSDMFLASLYANWFAENCYSEFGLSYSHAWNEADRMATDAQRYSGDYESDLYGGWLEGGYTMHWKNCQLEPYARATYMHPRYKEYTDKGGTAPMRVAAHSSDHLPTELGARTGCNWLFEGYGVIRLEFKAGWRREWLDNNISADGYILGVKIPLESPEADRDALVLGAKADLTITSSIQLGIEYEPVLSDNWFYHNINGELRIKF
jgi:uncharacterized protein with beta-barrel porin domain